jgi:hypothetical protein
MVNAIFTSDDWLETLRLSKARFLYACDELRSSVKKNDTSIRKAVEQRVALTLVFVDKREFLYNWTPDWCIQVGCVYDNEGNLQCFGCITATQVHTILLKTTVCMYVCTCYAML